MEDNTGKESFKNVNKNKNPLKPHSRATTRNNYIAHPFADAIHSTADWSSSIISI